MTTALITHAAGPLTPALVTALAERGITATVLAGDVFTARRVLPRDAVVATAGASGLAPFLRGHDIVIDNRVMAPGRRSSGDVGLAYTRQTTRLLTAAVAARTAQYVHVRPLGGPRHQEWAHRRVAAALADIHPARMSVVRVAHAPLLGPESGATTEANSLIARVVLRRLPAVGLGSTSLLSAADAALGIVATALDGGGSRVLPGYAHSYSLLTSMAACLLGVRPPAAVPARVARLAAAVADLVGGSFPVPLPTFSPAVVDTTDGRPWPAVLLREDVRLVVEHYLRGAVSA